VLCERARAWLARLRRGPVGLVDMTRLLPVTLAVSAIGVLFSAVLILADVLNPVHLASEPPAQARRGQPPGSRFPGRLVQKVS